MIHDILNKQYFDITEEDFNLIKQRLSTLEQYRLMVHTHMGKHVNPIQLEQKLDTIRYILKSDESAEKKCKTISLYLGL